MTDFPEMPPLLKTDCCLKFPDADMATHQMWLAGYTLPEVAMQPNGKIDVTGKSIISSVDNVIVVDIGTIYTTTGSYMNTTTKAQSGYHVNIRKTDGPFPSNLSSFVINPVTPRNVLA